MRLVLYCLISCLTIRWDFAGEDIGTDIRSRPLSVRYQGQWTKEKLSTIASITHSQNLSGGSFNDDASYALSRAGADSDWSKQNLSVRMNYKLAKKLADQFVTRYTTNQ